MLLSFSAVAVYVSLLSDHRRYSQCFPGLPHHPYCSVCGGGCHTFPATSPS